MNDDRELDAVFRRLREAVDNAAARLYWAVADACPGEHWSTQHRDGRPAWCRHCGRNDRGVTVKGFQW